jgi:3-deoxy-D-manno-octulosonic-acid transferase
VHLWFVAFAETVYQTALTALRRAAPLAARVSQQVSRNLEERAASAQRFAAWALASRDRTRPLIVFHGASAGELRQAEPVIGRIRRRHPEWQIAVTSFSPSGLAVARSLPADVAGLLPLDLEDEVTAFLEALSPAALVVTKLDLWPTLTRVAAARGTRLGLIAGRVRPRSRRLGWAARAVLTPAYRALAAVGAAAADDAARLARLGARSEIIRILGDPRFDSVLERIAGRPAPAQNSATLVAGSTWPRDEWVLLRVFARLRQSATRVRLVIAPHQPTPAAMTRLAAWATRFGLPQPRPHELATGDDPLVALTEVGPLAFLYGEGIIAYVGGGFRPGGLHSVLEPAAWGVPIIAGPDARANPEAELLREAGALVSLPERGAAEVLYSCWQRWLTESARRAEAGTAARRVLERGTGAADRSAELVEGLIAVSRQPSAISQEPPGG